MVKIFKEKSEGKGKKIGIVAARFNEFITERLLAGCLDTLYSHGVKKSDVTLVWVPGAFEIPLIASKLIKKKNIHTVICLGAVIRGETFHFELVAEEAARGIAQVSLMSGKPVIFGVLSTYTVDQAYKRSRENGDNKGADAAIAALEMAAIVSKLKT